jgi:hypothetical protein
MQTNRFYFNWLVPYDPLAKNDVFYCEGYNHNPVVRITFNNREVMISCDGEMNFYIGDTRVRSRQDLEEAGVKSDTDWELLRDDPDYFHDGLFPWFDAYEWSDSVGDWIHLEMVNGILDHTITQVQRYLMGFVGVYTQYFYKS